jgi:HK97 family phage major capsid protein
MPYNNIISRADIAALIPDVIANEVIQALPQQSAALRLFRKLTMSSAQMRLPVLSALPIAYFVNGDTGLKQTAEMAWGQQFLNVEEIAAIVPIAEAVLDDSTFDIWAEVQPRMVEAIGRALDAAVFFGTNKPASWPTAIVPAAVAAGNTVVSGTETAAQGGVTGDISNLFAAVEDQGYDVNGVVANRTFKGLLRNARATTGQQLDPQAGIAAGDSIYGVDISYPLRGLWPSGLSAAEMIAGDFSMGILGVRQDLTFKILDQAIIQDNSGVIQYNLAQQDMVAMRVVARFAWTVAAPIEPENISGAYPFGVMRTAAS